MSIVISELIDSFKEWVTFSKSLRGLPKQSWDSSMETGKWTIKDIVCHIMLWDKYFYEEAIHKIAFGQTVTLQHLNYDEFNGRAIIFAKTITTDELIVKAISYREKIIADIEALSEDAVNQNYIDGDGKVFHVPQYLKDFIWHDRHHIEPIKAYLAAIKF
jgi:hypothetical protein